jgi:hypothetical protein
MKPAVFARLFMMSLLSAGCTINAPNASINTNATANVNANTNVGVAVGGGASFSQSQDFGDFSATFPVGWTPDLPPSNTDGETFIASGRKVIQGVSDQLTISQRKDLSTIGAGVAAVKADSTVQVGDVVDMAVAGSAAKTLSETFTDGGQHQLEVFIGHGGKVYDLAFSLGTADPSSPDARSELAAILGSWNWKTPDVSPSLAPALTGSDYFPLGTGYTWKFDVLANGEVAGSALLESSPVSAVDSLPQANLKFTITYSDNTGIHSLVRNGATKILADRVEQNDDQGNTYIVFKTPLTVGDNWSDAGGVSSLSAQENVSVPYGLMPAAYKVTSSKKDGTSSSVWYAKGVGLVKEVDKLTNGVTLEYDLTSFTHP